MSAGTTFFPLPERRNAFERREFVLVGTLRSGILAVIRSPGSCRMPGKARERGKREGGDQKGEASSRSGQFAAGREPFLPEESTRRKQKMESALPACVSQLWGGEMLR